MITACFSMDLYCENSDSLVCDPPTCPTPHHRWPAVYTGWTWGECVRQARREGWKIVGRNKAYCPKCSGKKKS